ncbi:MAG: paraquat-inducible protein B [Bacteroidetes bacterium CG12_big_fil_rev_8_21_14_0_65_60_17]|nr:MAG: paraquat-inducible protein B [Bacteroidetes bacterium CG12_big_fil_rev_8_21_14_0_65_60_17]
MSIRANPTAIGLFMIGALILTVTGVTVLASTAWFTKQSEFVSYFGESVNGLDIGAPVKFQGVRIGNVTDLLIRIDQTDKTFEVPVQYKVDLNRLTSQTGEFVDLRRASVLQQQIDDGLRAQLQMESIVTGLLYIELTYREDTMPYRPAEGPSLFPEIPTSPSLLSAFGTQAGSLVGEVLTVLFRINEMLEAVDMEELNASLVASAQSIERLAEAPQIRAAFEEIPAMTAQFNATMAEVQFLAERLGAAIDPLEGQIDSTSAELVLTLQAMRAAVDNAQGLFSTDSGVGYQMQDAFSSLRDAADALRELSLSLERNPDMLLRGKKPQQQRP